MSGQRAAGGKPRPSKRRRTREAALQALYQQQITGDIAKDVINQFADSDRPGSIDEEMFRELLLGIETDREQIEKKLEPFCDRPLTALDPVERAAILIGAYELISRIAVPYRVAM
ncbi:MAG: transcription antitermination factor NusB, partial [Pseudomonadota bacterium]